MVRYLLGELTEEERITIEERFFTDYSYFEELLSVEGALFDDYLAGELSDREVERIRKNLLASRFQVQELETTRDLIETARQLPLRPEEQEPEVLEPPLSLPSANGPASVSPLPTVAPRLSEVSRPQIVGRPRPALAIALATAAAVFAVIALASIFYLWRELTGLREQYANLARQTEEIKQSIEPPSLLLIPTSQFRSNGDQPPAIKIRTWMQTFTLKLKINERSHQRYSVLIEKVGQKITDPAVWKNEFRVENITEQGTVELTLATSDFPAADYMVTIKGLDTDRKPLTLYYYFAVER